ncbi:MAG TPA: hypothetical protein VK989_02315 [Polyangia bacterium]|nr:hypothetical protein [Polyangia bacterium]
MSILRIIVVLGASIAAAAQFLTERHRLKIIRRLPGREARDYYEATRERGERLMIAVTAALALAAIGALVMILRRGA